MAEDGAKQDVPRRRRGGIGAILLGLAAAGMLGAGGYFAAREGLVDAYIPGQAPAAPQVTPLGDIAFVPLDPILIALPRGAQARTLRFAGQLEVEGPHAEEMRALMPRVVDVLNTYLRAVRVEDLEAPGAITRMRYQMLRRVQVVAGEGRVRDLLIAEFVLI